MLRFMGSQRVGRDWATELNWTDEDICSPNCDRKKTQFKCSQIKDSKEILADYRIDYYSTMKTYMTGLLKHMFSFIYRYHKYLNFDLKLSSLISLKYVGIDNNAF